MRILLALALILAFPAYAKSGGKSSASCASTHAARGGGGHGRVEKREAPPLASDRKVLEQDCARPIDWTAGNVKCK